jgi:ABC-2 type transport system ATP-binding protein
VKNLNQEHGVTVILTTHDMDDIEALCSRVLVIADGKLLSDGPLESLRAQVTKERWLVIDIDVAQRIDPSNGLFCGAKILSVEGNRVTLAFDPSTLSTAALIHQISERVTIRDLLVHDPPIEQIIARLYKNT